jgi:hypothetical protein
MRRLNLAKLTAVLGLWGLLAVGRAPAAFTDNFDALRAELVARSVALSNSTDKLELKQKKSCDKIIGTIDKSTTLAGDLKTVGTVAKGLAKAFAAEFSGSSRVFSNNLATLVDQVGDGLANDVHGELDAVQLVVNALPEGADKVRVQDALNTAATLIDQAVGAGTFADLAKGLASALKGILKSEQLAEAAQGGGGGGGGGGAKGLSCKVNGQSFNALGAAGSHVGITGQFTVTGATLQRAVTIIAFGVHGPGTYAAGGGTQVQEVGTGVSYTGNLTGTVTVVTFDLAGQKATGTFSFHATKTTPTPSSDAVDVTEGTFNISTIAAF